MLNNKFNTKIKLNNSTEMPCIGFGTYLLEDVYDSIKNAVKLGYRSFDSAKLYNNEQQIGKAINELIHTKTVTREEIFITTKLWNDDQEDPVGALKEALKRYKLDYVDLFLIHWPIGKAEDGVHIKQIPLYKLWENMEKCVELGLTKSIGVCNYNVQLLQNLISFAKIKPVCNQIEVHPLFNQDGLVSFCKKFDIAVVAFNPLARGNSAKKNKEFENIDLLKNKIIIDLSGKYKKTCGQIILNWHISRGVCVIPKSSNSERQSENLQSLDFVMEKEDYEKINCLNIDMRFVHSKGKFVKDIDVFA